MIAVDSITVRFSWVPKDSLSRMAPLLGHFSRLSHPPKQRKQKQKTTCRRMELLAQTSTLGGLAPEEKKEPIVEMFNWVCPQCRKPSKWVFFLPVSARRGAHLRNNTCVVLWVASDSRLISLEDNPNTDTLGNPQTGKFPVDPFSYPQNAGPGPKIPRFQASYQPSADLHGVAPVAVDLGGASAFCRRETLKHK